MTRSSRTPSLPPFAPKPKKISPVDEQGEVKPPLILQPPQQSNDFQSFDEQCIIHCITAYEASPSIPEAPIDDSAPPRLLHFIFVGDLASEFHIVFTFMDYMTIRSAYLRLQPDGIYLHTNMPCQPSPLWDMIRPMIAQHDHLEPITEIYGNKVTGRAHFSDVARLQILQKYGGMYMDIDSISLRPFTDDMWNPMSGMAMGYQDSKNNEIGCGVIIAKNTSMYLTRWLESYKTFNDKNWADHTVLMAGSLAKEFPNEINVFNETYFYRPLFKRGSIELLWEEHPIEKIDMFTFEKAYAPHYWGTIARKDGKIKRMTPSTILHENVGIHQILRPLLPFPYFSIVVTCDASTSESYAELEKTLASIVNQDFELWEILLVESSSAKECITYMMDSLLPLHPRLERLADRHIRRVIQEDSNSTHALWNINLSAGKTLPTKHVLKDILNTISTHPNIFQGTQNETDFRFIFDAERVIHRVP